MLSFLHEMVCRSNLRREPSRHRLATSTPSANDPIDELDETCLRGDFDFLEVSF